MSQCKLKILRPGQNPLMWTICIRIESCCRPRATAVVANRRYSHIVSQQGVDGQSCDEPGRLFGLTAPAWSVPLGSFMLWALLTLLFWSRVGRALLVFAEGLCAFRSTMLPSR